MLLSQGVLAALVSAGPIGRGLAAAGRASTCSASSRCRPCGSSAPPKGGDGARPAAAAGRGGGPGLSALRARREGAQPRGDARARPDRRRLGRDPAALRSADGADRLAVPGAVRGDHRLSRASAAGRRRSRPARASSRCGRHSAASSPGRTACAASCGGSGSGPCSSGSSPTWSCSASRMDQPLRIAIGAAALAAARRLHRQGSTATAAARCASGSRRCRRWRSRPDRAAPAGPFRRGLSLPVAPC